MGVISHLRDALTLIALRHNVTGAYMPRAFLAKVGDAPHVCFQRLFSDVLLWLSVVLLLLSDALLLLSDVLLMLSDVLPQCVAVMKCCAPVLLLECVAYMQC